jgi:hypothetical protein
MARMISFLQDPKKVTILYRILHEFLWAVWYVSGRINAVIMITPYSFFVYTNSCFVLPYFIKINSSAHKLIFREHNIISNPLFQHKMPPKPTTKAGPHRHSALTKTDNTYRSQSTSPQFPSSWKETDLVDQVAVVNAIKSIDSIKSVPEDERDCLNILMSKLSRGPLEQLFARYVDKDKNKLPSKLKEVRDSIVSGVMLERLSASTTISMSKPTVCSQPTHTTEKRTSTSNVVTPLNKKTKSSSTMRSVG